MKRTKKIYLGKVPIGGGSPVSIQSMTKTDTVDTSSTVRQIHQLERAGCEIIRVSVPDMQSADALPAIIKRINIPLVADIHFNWRLAVRSIENGASGVRINPGNIGGKKAVKEIVNAARSRAVPIRIGVNSGSLERKWKKKYNGITPAGLVASTLEYIKMIEDTGYRQIKVSIKTPDIRDTISCYRMISKKTRYPLHIGVTEAGPLTESAVRSSIVIGTLLMEGIGDTIRISVTGDPCTEVAIAKEILQSLAVRTFGPHIISCPTCARCKVDLIKIVKNLKRRISSTAASGIPLAFLKVAVMGCIVNGPGEAEDADIGIACGKAGGVLFKKGRPVAKIKEKDIAGRLLKELTRLSLQIT